LVVATYLSWLLLQRIAQVLQLIVVAGFFALALNPAVDFFQRRLNIRRGYAIAMVTIIGISAFTGMLYLFVEPLIQQISAFVDKLPQTLDDARNGKGQIGRLVGKYNLDEYIAREQTDIRSALTQSTVPLQSVIGKVSGTVFGLLTVLVLAILMLLEGPSMLRAPLVFFNKAHQDRIRKVASDASHSITGYVAGNLAISVIAGTVTFVTLKVMGVPFAVVLAVWVAFADLIPMIGATLGAIPTIAVSFLHSTRAGIVSVVVYVVYQQIENHILQPAIMAKTVKINPLMVIVSVLIGVELLGLLGALLAIPVAGAIQVIGRDVYDHREGAFKDDPTVGTDKIPAAEVETGTLNVKGDAQ